MAGQPVEALVHELAGAVEIPALMSQLGLEERQLRSTESPVLGEFVEPVVGVVVG